MFHLGGKVKSSCFMDLEGISNELWVALWDVLSVDGLCFATVEPIFKRVGQGWLQQSLYPWFSARSLLFSLLRLAAGY